MTEWLKLEELSADHLIHPAAHPHSKKVFLLYLSGIFCISVCAHCPCAFIKLTVTVLF